MKISIRWFTGEKPQFNVALASGDGKEPFIEIKGCRIANGRNGEFVSWPSNKKPDGTYWSHCYASEAFNAAVLAAVRESKPAAPKQRPKDEQWRAGAPDTSRDDAPF